MSMTGVISGVITPNDKTRSNPLARIKSQDVLRICSKFLVFPSVIKKKEFTLLQGYQHQSMEVK